MILKKVGVFKELSYGEETDPSIFDYIDSNSENKTEIINYLKNGLLLAACTAVV